LTSICSRSSCWPPPHPLSPRVPMCGDISLLCEAISMPWRCIYSHRVAPSLVENWLKWPHPVRYILLFLSRDITPPYAFRIMYRCLNRPGSHQCRSPLEVVHGERLRSRSACFFSRRASARADRAASHASKYKSSSDEI
jgi:hypothetical protein